MRCRAVGIALVVLLLGGCGGTRTTTTTRTTSAAATTAATPTAPSASGCVRSGPGTRLVVAHAGGGATTVAVTGSGAIGVALLPQSNGDACEWNRLTKVLTADGMRVARINWEGDYVAEARGALAALRIAGARRTALLGASLGGHMALVVAAMRHAPVGAVVTLSAERTERSDSRDAARLARRIRIPSLTIGSRNDGWTTFGAETRAIHRAIAARVNVIRLVGGAAHGVDMLDGRTGQRLTAEIVRFLRREA